jgi:hypothetical protein
MIDLHAAQVQGHRRNIERYCRLLATELTDLEREYLHKRIAEEHAQLERLEKRQRKPEAVPADAPEQRTGGQSAHSECHGGSA